MRIEHWPAGFVNRAEVPDTDEMVSVMSAIICITLLALESHKR